jgi:hypothetical protein
MKNKLKAVLLCAALAPNIAQADGCWVNFNNPDYCSNETIRCTYDYFQDYDRFGIQVADGCSDVLYYSSEWDRCVKDYNALIPEFNRNIDIIDFQDNLIARLKRKIRKLKKKLRR